MRKTLLKKLDREVSVVSLGTSRYGSVPEGSPEEAAFVEVLRAAVDGGIDFLDSARGYLGGRCESLLGREIPRLGLADRVSIATKLPLLPFEQTLVEVEKSRALLRRDCIEVMYIHWPAAGKDARPMMEALESCRRRGWIRLIGVSNFSVEQLEAVAESGCVDIVQMGYNLLWRIHERDLIPYCRAKGIPITTYSSLAQGLLSGRFSEKPVFGPDDNRKRSIFFEDAYWPVVAEGVLEMKRVAEASGCPLAQIALEWLLAKEEVLSVVVGARTVAQLDSAFASAGNAHAAALAELTRISDRVAERLPSEGNIFQYYP